MLCGNRLTYAPIGGHDISSVSSSQIVMMQVLGTSVDDNDDEACTVNPAWPAPAPLPWNSLANAHQIR